MPVSAQEKKDIITLSEFDTVHICIQKLQLKYILIGSLIYAPSFPDKTNQQKWGRRI